MAGNVIRRRRADLESLVDIVFAVIDMPKKARLAMRELLPDMLFFITEHISIGTAGQGEKKSENRNEQNGCAKGEAR